MKRTLPEILNIQPLIDTDVFHIEAVDLKFSNGVQRRFERFIQWPEGIVMIVPILNDDTLLLIREYGVGTHQYHLTLPKGKVDKGEMPDVAANRELQEEIGYAAHKLTFLRPLTHSPSYSSTQMHLILAEDLYPSVLQGDEPEPIEVVPWPLKDLGELLANPDFNEARAIAALYLTQLHLKLI
jgi:ADP-ribose diphosphatase